MMQMLKNKKKFKQENLKSWINNTNYWLNSPLRQVEDTKEFFKKKLRETVLPGMRVIDMGCGSGWLLDFLVELNIPCSYIGLDFNNKFIEHLKKNIRIN